MKGHFERTMIIIHKNDLDKYRFAVGKTIFLESYAECKLIEDVPGSSCMWISENGKKKYISVFVAPSECNVETYVYYERMAYGKAKKKEKKNIIPVLFNDNFEDAYEREMVNALTNPKQYLESVDKEYYELFQPLLIDEEKMGEDIGFYKYWRAQKVLSNLYNVNDGDVSFSAPATFNDPFDCNCFFANNKSMSDLFRIFCVTPSYRNILMWSYYAEDHKGYCFQYKKKDIIKAIMSSGIDGLCLIGDVSYKKKRPGLRASKNCISFTDLKFYCEVAFTKYEEWKHEREFRFVVISNAYPRNSSYLTLNTKIYDVYEGCNGSGRSITDSKGKPLHVHKMGKHPNEYKLI